MRSLINKYFPGVIFSSVFVLRNLWCARKIKPFTETNFKGFLIKPLSREYLPEVADCFRAWNGGLHLDRPTLTVLRLLGTRISVIAIDPGRNEVVGMGIYYFNARDRKEGTVHGCYVGLCERVRGGGLAGFISRYALNHFASSGLSGASARVSFSNAAAFAMNTKVGFVPAETYFDPAIGEERYYLICDFRKDGISPQ